jgi:hypothetical protein
MMKTTFRTIAAVLAGLFGGGALNMEIVMISERVIPSPKGVDATTVEGLAKGMNLMEPKHFLMPFLAHALGTMLGAFIATMISKNHHLRAAMSVGIVFLVGGVSAVYMLPSPLWFSVTDLTLAYLPMAWIGYKMATNFTQKANSSTSA